MLGDGNSKMKERETSGMQHVDCDEVFCLTQFILLQKSSLVVITSGHVSKS